MNKTKNFLLGLVLSVTAAQSALAGNVDYDYADVINVTPVTRSVEVSTPQRECWYEEIPQRAEGRDGTGGLILGGIAGGVIGNRFGGGNGKKAATVAGTIAGAMIGRELSRRPDEHYSTTRERCETVHTRRYEERIVGYDVRYRYNGQDYVTRSDRDPGRRIRVRVSVTPLL